MNYRDPDLYRWAFAEYQREKRAFETQESKRIAQLTTQLTSVENLLGPMAVLYFVAIVVAGVLIVAVGFWAGVVLFIVELIPLTLAYEGLGRVACWLARDQLVPRTFAVAPPTFQPTSSPPPRREQPYSAPPPRAAESPRRSEPDQTSEPAKITSLRQAIEILGLPPKTTLSEAKAAYRTLMAGCHPDKVMHLDPEIRALAARKTLQLNLALQYIQQHLRK